MAIFRKIHVQFWSDVFIQSLTPEQKFFFLYLLTNERTKQCGIYEITTRQISFDTGYNVDTINNLIEFFTKTKKVIYSRETNEIAIKNWDRYNGSRSPDVQNLVNKELKSVKNIKLIEWIQSVDTVVSHSKKSLREEPEEEREQEPEKESEPEYAKKIFKPKPEYEINLPEMDIGRAVQYITLTKHVPVNNELVLALFGAFKTKNFTGKKTYSDDRDIIRHFFESLKFLKIDGKLSTKSVGKTLEFDNP